MPCELSVIVVNWNGRAFIGNCLGSLLEEVRELDAEVIVIDNGSTDGSPKFIKEVFPKIRLIGQEENLGFAGGTNIGLKESRGRFICLVNSDVVVLKGSLRKMLAYMLDHEQVGLIGPKVYSRNSVVEPNTRNFPTLWNSFCYAFYLDHLGFWLSRDSDVKAPAAQNDTIRRVEVVVGILWFIRRTAFEEVGYLDEKFFMYGEDVDWCKRFHQTAWEMVYFPEACIIHDSGGSSKAAPVRFYVERQRSNLIYWRKHHGRLSRMVYRWIILLQEINRLIYWSVRYALGGKDGDVSLKIERYVRSLFFLFGCRLIRAGRIFSTDSDGG